MSKMPALLLPDTAAPFAPRSTCTVVLSTKVDPWLTATLKRINRIKRPLNSVPQHQKCLTETLSQASAIWNLCSLLIPRAPASHFEEQDHDLVDAFTRFEPMHVQAYVVHVDLVCANEVAFKLSKDTIDDLVDYHKETFLVDQSEGTWQWTEKEAQLNKMHQAFVQAVNKFIYRADASTLEGLEDDGAGELLCGRSEDVKSMVQALFLPLLPPPPRIMDAVRSQWWAPTAYASQPPLPVDPMRIVPSSPIEHSPPPQPSTTMSAIAAATMAATTGPSYPTLWGTSTGMSDFSSMYAYSSPPISMPMIPQLPLPSLIAQQCSTGIGGGFGWDNRFQDYATTI